MHMLKLFKKLKTSLMKRLQFTIIYLAFKYQGIYLLGLFYRNMQDFLTGLFQLSKEMIWYLCFRDFLISQNLLQGCMEAILPMENLKISFFTFSQE